MFSDAVLGEQIGSQNTNCLCFAVVEHHASLDQNTSLSKVSKQELFLYPKN